MTDLLLQYGNVSPGVSEQTHAAARGQFGATRPVIVIVIPSDWVAKVLLGSGAFTLLALRADLRFITSPTVTVKLSVSARTECLDLPSLGTGLRRRLDHHMWNHALFHHLRRLGIDVRTSFKAAQLRPSVRLLHRVLTHPAFAGLISAIDRQVLFRQDREATRRLTSLRPSLLLAPGSAIDSYSHMMMRSAKRLGIPTAMIVTHWDYFSKKGLLRVTPDRIYAWGKDMVNLVAERDGISRDVLRVVGAPQFEKYRCTSSDTQRKARLQLGLPPDDILVLFAGTAVPFDELSVLSKLAEVARKPRFAGCHIVYRPHPSAWKRRYAEAVDPAALPNVLIDAPTAADTTSDDHYVALMAAVDGVASPFSTMSLEGALAGKPAFCVAFADEVNDWDFAEVNNSEHVQPIIGRSWLTVCRERSRLQTQFAEFLDKLQRGIDADLIRREASHTVYFDGRSYAQRLLDQIETDFSL